MRDISKACSHEKGEVQGTKSVESVLFESSALYEMVTSFTRSQHVFVAFHGL